MSTRITQCPECDSREFEVINPKDVETSRDFTVTLHAVCAKCKCKFTFTSATDHGHKCGILY